MRGSLVVLCAGLAGGFVSTGCKSKAAKPAPTPPATVEVATGGPGATGPSAGVVTAGGPGAGNPGGATAGAVPPTSPGATGPDASFELSIAKATAAAAATGSARLVVHPGPGLHMNLDYPIGLTLTPPAGVTLAKTAFATADVEKLDGHELALSVSMSATAPGEYRVPGTFRFAVCDDGSCYPKKRAVELVLAVQ